MWYHCGAARSCSSFADLVIKNSQRFKANFSLNRWLFFMTRSAKPEQLWAAPPWYMIAHSYLVTPPVPPRAAVQLYPDMPISVLMPTLEYSCYYILNVLCSWLRKNQRIAPAQRTRTGFRKFSEKKIHASRAGGVPAWVWQFTLPLGRRNC